MSFEKIKIIYILLLVSISTSSCINSKEFVKGVGVVAIVGSGYVIYKKYNDQANVHVIEGYYSRHAKLLDDGWYRIGYTIHVGKKIIHLAVDFIVDGQIVYTEHYYEYKNQFQIMEDGLYKAANGIFDVDKKRRDIIMQLRTWDGKKRMTETRSLNVIY